MKIQPDYDEIRAAAAAGQYKVYPIHCELLSDFCTPIEALRILKNVSTHCFLLESILGLEKWGRYTFLGFDPKLEITCCGGVLKAGSLCIQTDDPAAYLRQVLADYKTRAAHLHRRSGGVFLLRLPRLQRAVRSQSGCGQ